MTSKIKDFTANTLFVENLESSRLKDGKVKKKGFVVWKLRSILLAFLLIWCLSAVLIYLCFDSWGSRGTFGDLFGAISSAVLFLCLNKKRNGTGLFYTVSHLIFYTHFVFARGRFFCIP
ncbi:MULTISPECIES: hypothetical protein [Paenibacillus]|uniref:hypothetical protein n=1 Tax=Paenibacillus TaxID=44249 RepID=UPI0012B6B446|nr:MULTISPECIES: hypothetical protein [Paenibacillus]